MILILLLAGISLGAVFLLGRGLFAPRVPRWIDLAGHVALICLGAGELHFLTQTFRAFGSVRLRFALISLVLALVLVLVGKRLFSPSHRKWPPSRRT